MSCNVEFRMHFKHGISSEKMECDAAKKESKRMRSHPELHPYIKDVKLTSFGSTTAYDTLSCKQFECFLKCATRSPNNEEQKKCQESCPKVDVIRRNCFEVMPLPGERRTLNEYEDDVVEIKPSK